MKSQVLSSLFLMAILPPSLLGEPSWVSSGLKYASTKPKEENAWFALDKVSHLTVSAFLTGFSYRIYLDEFENPEENSRIFATTFSALLGIGKEVIDSTSLSSSASWKDLAADGVGILLGLFLFTSTF